MRGGCRRFEGGSFGLTLSLSKGLGRCMVPAKILDPVSLDELRQAQGEDFGDSTLPVDGRI